MKNAALIIVLIIIGLPLMMLSGCVDEDKKHQNYTSSTPVVNLSSAADNDSKKEKAEKWETFKKDIRYTIYRDNDFNFSMEYPETWVPITKDNATVFVSDQHDMSGYVTISVQMLSSHKTGGRYVTVKDVLNDLVEQFKEGTKNFSIHYINDVAFGNVKGTEIKVSYELDDMEYVQTTAIVEGNNYFYALMYLSSPKNYDKYVKIYEHAKNTFNLFTANNGFSNKSNRL